jgi:hypothetical protein
MSESTRTLSLLAPVAFVALTLAAAPSLAVVTYGPNAGTDTSPFRTPGNEYYGMNWSYVYRTGLDNVDVGGTSVAVGYFTLLTARHFGPLAVGTTFTANGDTFSVTSIDWLSPDPGQSKPPDLRVLHVENLTNKYRPLPGFYELYTYPGGSSTTTAAPAPFPTSAQSFVFVGTGNTGETMSPSYYTDTPDTRRLRWGSNRYDGLIRKNASNFSTQCIAMSYSRGTTDANKTLYESGLGDHDSGSGVFVKDPATNTWKLAGIGLYRDLYEGLPDYYSPMWAASIPYYEPKLRSLIHSDKLPGDLNMDGTVDSADYITLKANFGMTGATWLQGDFNGDGLVGYEDLFALETNFGYTPYKTVTTPDGSIPGGGMLLPEPGSAMLLALGAVALLRRRGILGKARQ